MVPDRPPPLERRTPGETDLTVFTTAPERAGRHRVDTLHSWLRVSRSSRPGGRPYLRLLALGVAALLAAGCGTAAQEQARPAPGPLSAVCPERIVVQAAWTPTADLALPFQLMGPEFAVDKDRMRVTAPLLDGGRATGVMLEFRSGGPATTFQTGPAVAYQDRDVTLAFTNTDEIIGLSQSQPMTAVMAPLNGDPQVLIWDPGTYPEFNTVSDIGQTDTKVVYSTNASTVFGYLDGSGALRGSQLDASYDGTPERFISSRGKVVVQGYATNEPHVYGTHPKWGRPVRSTLIQDTGYPNNANMLAVPTRDLGRLRGCLTSLVPVLQRGLLAFANDPRAALSKIVTAVREFNRGATYDTAAATYGACQLRLLGLMSNPMSGVAGGVDDTKLQRMIDITTPLFAAARKPVRAGLNRSDVATTEFLDPDITLPASLPLTGLDCAKAAGQ
jgi:hypothetical protein